MSNITVRHSKVSNIADHPVSVNAGEIVPSDWNADHNVSVTSLDGVPIGSTTPSTGTFTTVTANEEVILKNGTPPTSGISNAVQVYSSDVRADATIPSLWTEGQVVAAVTPTANRGIPVRINGTVYYLLASTVDYSTSPTLDLVFSGATSLDPVITFTRASGGTYFNSSGVLTTASTDGPRLDYNPSTLAARGFLIEEQRTNLLTYSEQFDNAAWVKGEGSATSNAVTAPDGTLTADLIIPNTNSVADHTAIQNTSIASGTAIVVSVFAKAAGYNFLFIRGFGLGAGGGAGFNLNTGTVTQVNNYTSASITNVGNGWYRCVAIGTAAISSGSAFFNISDTDVFQAWAGNGTSGIYLWGAQVEAGAFPTSYIKTEAASATRSADVASVNTLSPWFNSAAGTIVGEFAAVASGTRTVSAFDDNTANESIRLRTVSTDPKFTVTDGGSDVADIDAGTVATNTVYKFAGAYAVNDFAACINGGTVQTDTSGTLPTVDRFRIGTSQAGNYLNGWVRRLSYYPRRLGNAEMQSVTT